MPWSKPSPEIVSPSSSTIRGSQGRTNSHDGRLMIVPLPLSVILDLPLRSFLTAIPKFAEFLPGFRQTPANRRLLPSNDGRDFRGRKALQILQNQDRAVRDR